MGPQMSDFEAPTRAREDRAAGVAAQRRRRQPGSLNRMVSSNLGIPEDCLDPEYHYHWINDVRGRVQSLTINDDYDIVTIDDLEAAARKNRADFSLFNRNHFMTGEGSQITVPVERDGTKAVLMRKPKVFYDADYEEQVASRQAMMEARVYEGDLSQGSPDKAETLGEDITYAPKGNTLGGTAPRRRGPIPKRFK